MNNEHQALDLAKAMAEVAIVSIRPLTSRTDKLKFVEAYTLFVLNAIGVYHKEDTRDLLDHLYRNAKAILAVGDEDE